MKKHTHSYKWSGVARIRIGVSHFDVPVRIDVPCTSEKRLFTASQDPDEVLQKEATAIAEAVITDAGFEEFFYFPKAGSITVAVQRECTMCQQTTGRLIAFTLDLNSVQSKDNPMQWIMLEHELIKALASTIFMNLKSRAPFPAAAIHTD